MLKGYKYRIFPTDDQKDQLQRYFGVIGRFSPSSKVCSHCGNHKKDLKLSDRTYDCDKCGNSMDRDLNAAYNIKNFGVRDNPLYANVSH